MESGRLTRNPGLDLGRGPVLGPFVGAKLPQGDLEEWRSEPPHRNSHPASSWGHLQPIPVQVLEEHRWWLHLLHGLDTSSARLACAIALVPLLIPAQLSILCPWRWISPFQLPPTFLPSPFLQPMLLYWRCDSGAGSGTVGSWEPRFLAACNHQSVLPGTPAWSGISPSLSLPTSWWQARGNLNIKDSSGLIKPWGYSQWLVQTGGQAVAEMLYYHGLEKWRKSFFFLANAGADPCCCQDLPETGAAQPQQLGSGVTLVWVGGSQVPGRGVASRVGSLVGGSSGLVSKCLWP